MKIRSSFYGRQSRRHCTGLLVCIAFMAIIASSMTACNNPSGDDSATHTEDDPGVPVTADYIITGSGTSFKAVNKSGAAVGTTGAILNVINSIRTDANGSDCIIQFGNGNDVLNIGNAPAIFSRVGGPWGKITLLGKITSSYSFGTLSGTIELSDNVPMDSYADIANTGGGNAIYNSDSSKTITVKSGTVSAILDGNAISNRGPGSTVIVEGGTISATKGYAIYNTSTTTGSGTVNSTATVSGGVLFAWGSSGKTGVYNDFVTLGGDGLVIWWNTANGIGTYTKNSSTYLGKEPGAAAAVWDNVNGSGGISYTNGSNTGFIAIDGVTVE